MEKDFKNATVDALAAEELKKRGITVNDLVKQAISKFEGTKKVKRIYNCHFVCGFKKKCISDFWKECPYLKHHPDYTQKLATLEVELMGKPNKKLKLIKEHREIIEPKAEDVTKEKSEETE